jgi:hypothetical protein
MQFDFTPEFKQNITTLTIQPDGLHGVGDLHLAGRNVLPLTDAIHRACSGILNAPSSPSFSKMSKTLASNSI